MAVSKTVRVVRLADVPLPARQTTGAAGFDLCAVEDVVVPRGGHATVGTGLAFQIPAGLEGQVRPRSGLALRHGIGLLNAPGTIDSDYRGEVRVILFNAGPRSFRIRAGERIAQLVFASTAQVTLEEKRRLTRTRRGSGGFGHTGV
jgi:dUTP pyrophosphatase